MINIFVLNDSVLKGMDFIDDLLLIECFLHLPPPLLQHTNSADHEWIYTKQNETYELLNRKNRFLVVILPEFQMINYLLHLHKGSQQHEMDDFTYWLDDQANYALVPQDAWSPWILAYASNTASKISPPSSQMQFNNLPVTSVNTLNQMVQDMGYFLSVIQLAHIGRRQLSTLLTSGPHPHLMMKSNSLRLHVSRPLQILLS